MLSAFYLNSKVKIKYGRNKVSSPVIEWKNRRKTEKGNLSAHFNSDSHKAALMSYAHFCDPLCHFDIMLDMSIQNTRVQKEAQMLEDMEAVMFDGCN